MNLLNKFNENIIIDIVNIDVNKINLNKFNKIYKTENIESLAESIKINGQLEPVVLYENEFGEFTLISGHRRFNAIKELNYTTIKSIVIEEPSNVEEEELLIIESNYQRIKTNNELENEIKKKKEIYTELKKRGIKKYANANINLLLSEEYNLSLSTIKRKAKAQNEPSKKKTKQEILNDQVLKIYHYIQKNNDEIEFDYEFYKNIEKHIKKNNQIELN